MRQEWHHLLFAHWPVSPSDLRPLIPVEFEVDTFEKQAWIGVVPFLMRNVTLRGMPVVPWLSHFPELNVRTYVRRNDRPGVYFFSLDAGNPVAVQIARRWFHLPYFNAQMQVSVDGEDVIYTSSRRHKSSPPAELSVRYGPDSPVLESKTDLEIWLTERYCLYTCSTRNGLPFRGEIHHRPWPLQRAWADIKLNTMAAAAGLELPETTPLLHYSRSIDMRAWTLCNC